MANHLLRLCYFSASRLTKAWDITCLVEQCRLHNMLSGLTGILLYEDKTFMQILEGETEVVEEVFRKIQRDPRHCYVTELHAVEADSRLFGEWPMAFMSRKEFSNARSSPNKEMLAALQQSYREAGNQELQKVLSSFFLDVKKAVS
jgi:hypothetical protein